MFGWKSSEMKPYLSKKASFPRSSSNIILIKREHSSGESVSVRVYAHNQTWVECLIDEEDQPVIIHKDNLPQIFDTENGIWPETGEKIDNVVLMEHRAYELRGPVFVEREIIKQPFRGECVS